ncbi:heparan-alpha-glucosaminide N-acetyltransferase domain-containing protein [Telluria mixta]|uniref:Heparan-alpha-glucosaminide N-acetyltransferase domain-containing protein n=1 Tax=Telluria mixta TaxID=34071 RepID=A0ABT2BWU6_9BURK|nr:heparan-alpha-glucosaminide N-acetyltransferase domain-containing protein [Telluria mixta]MCS0629605.1 heparan-alpha-glucosaminide N-acetyltransferase domain-containing protein [Telluria mixta]WEM96824.1 heparan-alpha-glucosaminide N-acetyltransferase domain-containing protein [Telluria mixta]
MMGKSDLSTPRVIAIDLLRGLAVMGMIMVAYAGGWERRFTFLTHADWRGFAIADMIFPAFLFCAGASLPYALARRVGQGRAALVGHVLRRSAVLVALGVLLNLLPGFDVAHVRLPGILQRIGLCYAIVGTGCVLALRRDGLRLGVPVAAGVALLVGYAALLLAWDAPGCGRACFDSMHSLPAVVDRAVFGVAHLWPWGKTGDIVTFDPEGLVSTLGALVNVLFGVTASLLLMRSRRPATLTVLAIAGVACLLAGFLLDPLVPVVKKLWTPSFALVSGGFTLLSLLVLMRLVPPGEEAPAWTRPVLAFGTNATLAFVGITLIDTVMQLQLWAGAGSGHDLLAAWLADAIPEARVASAAYSALLLLVLGAGLWQLFKRRIVIRI